MIESFSFYGLGYSTTMKLRLRRTLVRSKILCAERNPPQVVQSKTISAFRPSKEGMVALLQSCKVNLQAYPLLGGATQGGIVVEETGVGLL